MESFQAVNRNSIPKGVLVSWKRTLVSGMACPSSAELSYMNTFLFTEHFSWKKVVENWKFIWQNKWEGYVSNGKNNNKKLVAFIAKAWQMKCFADSSGIPHIFNNIFNSIWRGNSSPKDDLKLLQKLSLSAVVFHNRSACHHNFFLNPKDLLFLELK